MDKYVAYKSEASMPTDLKPGQVFVDMQNHCVLIPNSPTTFIPFHISTIKSASETAQGQWTFLRINFHTPQTAGNTMKFPEQENTDDLSIN
jgi:nucleosome binding factor SPN SPT16 subunit